MTSSITPPQLRHEPLTFPRPPRLAAASPADEPPGAPATVPPAGATLPRPAEADKPEKSQGLADRPEKSPGLADKPEKNHGLALGRDHRALESDPHLPDALVTGLEHALRLMAAQAYAKVSVRVEAWRAEAGARPGGTQPPGSMRPPTGTNLPTSTTPPTGTTPPAAMPPVGPPPAGTPGTGGSSSSGRTGGTTPTGTTQPATFVGGVTTTLGFAAMTDVRTALQAQVTAGSTAPSLETSGNQTVAALGSTWQWSHARAALLADGSLKMSQDYAKTDAAGQQTTVSATQVLDASGQVTSLDVHVYTDISGGKGIAVSFAENTANQSSGTLTVQFLNFSGQAKQATSTGDATTALASLKDLLAKQGVTGASAEAILGSVTEALRAVGAQVTAR